MAKQQVDDETFKRFCADYVLNVLDQGERMRFEEMLDEASDEQREWYQVMRSKANELLFSDRENPSPEVLRAELIAEVEGSGTDDAAELEPSMKSGGDQEEKEVTKTEEEPDATTSSGSLGVVLSVVLGFICLSLVFYAFSLRSEIGALEDAIAGQEKELNRVENRMNELQGMLSVMDSRQLHVVRLLGMEANPFAYGNVVWDAQYNRVVASVSELPPAEEGEVYKLWAIFENRAMDITEFTVDEQGNALFTVRELEGIESTDTFSFTITLESREGSTQPNGEVHLMGSYDNAQ